MTDQPKASKVRGVVHFISSLGAGEWLVGSAFALAALPWTGLPKTENDWLMVAAGVLGFGACVGIAIMTRPEYREEEEK